MNNTCAIALKFRPVGMAWLGILPSARIAGFLREWRKHSPLRRLHFKTVFPALLHHLALRVSVVFPHNSSKLTTHFATGRALATCRYYNIRTNQEYAKENSSEETSHPGTLDGSQFRLRTTA